jgi:hypothetical protein
MDSDKAFLEIEFSLPKYFFGTNVFQLLGVPANSSEANFHMLLKAIKRVFNDKFNKLPKDSDVEIFRLDMCYNQFFKTKQDAIDYLSMGRDWMKRYCEGKNMRLVDSHDTTWTILTERYSFKCYHKGTEFHKKDYKKLVENMSKHNYNLNQLQGIADCILRYEITYRHSMLHYLTMYYTFQDLEKKRGYMLNSKLYDYIKRVQKRGDFAKHSSDIGIRIGVVSPVDYFIGKQKKFCLRSLFDGGYSPLVIYADSVTFNYKVYRLLYDWFWALVRKAQPDEAIPIFKMKEKLLQYQEKKARWKHNGVLSKDKLKKGNLREAARKNTARILIPALLSQYMDVRKLKDHLP